MPEIKVCGLTREEDVRLCLDLNVDYVGFVFVKTSPRYIDPERVAHMPRGRAGRVGVFAGINAKSILDIMKSADLDMAQLHGGEDVSVCRALGVHRVVKVLWPESYHQEKDLIADMARYTPYCRSFLLDAGVKGGGMGKPFNWRRLNGLPVHVPWWLAGGIGPHNARQASQYNAACLDINSCVETSPGVKDHLLLKTTIGLIRNPVSLNHMR